MHSNFEQIQAINNVFSSDEGKKALDGIRKACSMDDSTFRDNPTLMAFEEGRRSIGLWIHEIVSGDYTVQQESQEQYDPLDIED